MEAVLKSAPFHQTEMFFFLCLPASENTFLSLMKRYTAFRDEITFQMASDSPSLFPVLSHTRPPLLTPSTFTRPCECSIHCNCIQHFALQTADKPAQGQPPTLAMLRNRLFVQAYQSPYPLSLCGCLWTLSSLHQNRSLPLCEGGFGPAACSERPVCTEEKHCLKINNGDSQSLSLHNV